MDVIFHEDELLLLADMREKATGHDEEDSIDSATIAKDHGWNRAQLHKVQTYLAGWSLIAKGRVRTDHWVSYYLTKDGENFMRLLEREPMVQNAVGKGRALTLCVLKGMGVAAKDALVQAGATVLAKVLTGS